MALKTWNRSVTDSFSNAAAWTPAGVPHSGDVLLIQDGNPVATNQTLSDEFIILGGTKHAPGPANASLPGDYTGGILGIHLTTAPNPTLSLIGSTIAADTTVFVPTVPTFGGLQPDSATLFITGGSTTDRNAPLPVSENDGNIVAAGTPFTQGATLDLSIANAIFENRGTILAGYGSSIVMTGYKIQPEFIGLSATMHNDGTIAVYGSVADTTVGIDGVGTVILGSTLKFLNSDPTPGHFLFDNDGEVISSGQTFAFKGGHLDLNGSNSSKGFDGFQGVLSDFGQHPTDLITLKDFDLSTFSFSGGVLSLNGTTQFGTADAASLTFANLPQAGHFAVSTIAHTTDIRWQPA